MRIYLLVCVVLLQCWTSTAFAGDADPAAAELLFQEGRQALAQDELDKACRSFEESLRLQPAVGAALNLATCEEKRGKYASSWERWHQALDLMKGEDRRRDFAEKKAKEMEQRAPRLTVSPHSSWAGRLTITSGGARLGEASYARPLPVDPGERLIQVEANQHRPRIYRIVMKPGESRVLIVEPGPREVSEKNNKNHARQTQKVFAFIASGVGVAGLTTAIVTAALLPGIQTTVDDNCPGKVCNETGLDAGSRGQRALTANTVGWLTAGVGLAAGTVLFLTLPGESDQPESQQVGLAVDSDGASLRFQGIF